MLWVDGVGWGCRGNEWDYFIEGLLGLDSETSVYHDE